MTTSWGSQLAATTVVALALAAWSAEAGRTSSSSTQLLFWASLLVLFVPQVPRILGSAAGGRERQWRLVVTGVGLQLIHLVQYPTSTPHFDELLHRNTLEVLQRSHHLFGVNSLLPSSPVYPGLEVVTDAIARVTALPDQAAVYVVLIAARVLLVGAVYELLRRQGTSHRTASVGGLIYLCSPQLLFFNSQYAYESLAMPLALVAVLVIDSAVRRPDWRSVAASVTLVVATVVTHHLTGVFLAAFMTAWTLHARAHGRLLVRRLAVASAVVWVLAAAWMATVGQIVLRYLREIFQDGYNQVRNLVLGGTHRTLFSGNAGSSIAPWERVVSLGSVGILTLAVGWSFVRWFRGERLIETRDPRRSLGAVFVYLSAIYPALLAARFSEKAGEIAQRASTHVFIGIATGVAVTIAMLQMSAITRRLIAMAFVVVFVGQQVIGAGVEWQRVPGPYLVSADARSIDDQGRAVAAWFRDFMPPGGRVAADRVNRLLVTTIGGQIAVTSLGDNADLAPVYERPTVGPNEWAELNKRHVDFLLVDRRLADSLPEFTYFDFAPPGGQKQLTIAALTKFDHDGRFERIYDNGVIAVYRVGASRA